MRTGKAYAQSGFTYFGLLVAIATVAMGVGAGAGILSNDLRRDKELDLLFAGDAIRRALEAYHTKNSSGVNPFPKQLDWLLRDPNQPTIQRHLRKVFRDPMHDPEETGAFRVSDTWVLISNAEGQIVGVRSNSRQTPLKKSGFPKPYENFSLAKTYSDWHFIAAGAVPSPAQSGSQTKNFIPTPLAPGVPLVPGVNPVPVLVNPQPSAIRPAPQPSVSGSKASVTQLEQRAPEPPITPLAVPAAAAVASIPPVPVAAPPSTAPPAANSASVPPAALATPAATPTPPTPPTPAPVAPAVAEPTPFGSGPQPFIIRSPKDF